MQSTTDCADGFVAAGVTVSSVVLFFSMIGLIAVGGIAETNMNSYSNSLTEMMYVLMRAVAMVELVTGTFGLFAAIVGFVLTRKPSKELHIVYLIMMLLLLITMFGLIVIYSIYNVGWYKLLRSQWSSTLSSYFTDVATSSAVSVTISSYAEYAYLWNQMMFDLKCCGVNAYTDYQSATNWAAMYTVTSSGVSYAVAAVIPAFCCVQQSGAQFPTLNVASTQCITAPTTGNSYYSTTCYSALLQTVAQPSLESAALAFWSVSIIAEAFGFAASCVALSSERYIAVQDVGRARKIEPAKQQVVTERVIHHYANKESTIMQRPMMTVDQEPTLQYRVASPNTIYYNQNAKK